MGTIKGVLVVDDEENLAFIVSSQLKRAGYRVFTSHSGCAARDLFAAHQSEIEAVVTDFVMPDARGDVIATEFLAEKPGLKVVIMSGNSLDSLSTQFELRDGENFLQKPFPPQALLTLLRRDG